MTAAGTAALPLARTSEEAHAYMDLRPCACGEAAFARASSVAAIEGGLAAVYRGACPRCGAAREFRFRLPEVALPPGAAVRFGGDEPSELLDAGEWLAVADRLASRPTPPRGAPPEERRRAARDLERAAAAIDEVLKLTPAGADAVPASALRSETGRAVHAAEPGRFRRARLTAVRDTYRRLAADLAP